MSRKYGFVLAVFASLIRRPPHSWNPQRQSDPQPPSSSTPAPRCPSPRTWTSRSRPTRPASPGLLCPERSRTTRSFGRWTRTGTLWPSSWRAW